MKGYLIIILSLFPWKAIDAQTASEYYLGIEANQSSIIMAYFDYLDLLNDEKWQDAKSKLNELTILAGNAVEETQAYPDPEDNNAFKKAAGNLFAFYNQSFMADMPEVLLLMSKPNYTEEDDERINELLDNYALTEMALLDELITSQQQFLKSNNLDEEGLPIAEPEIDAVEKEQQETEQGEK